jgi:hypothetical protein
VTKITQFVITLLSATALLAQPAAVRPTPDVNPRGSGFVLARDAAIQDGFWDAVNAQDFGAFCDGITDAAPALRAAIATGGSVIIPSCVNGAAYPLGSYDATIWQNNAIVAYLHSNQTILCQPGATLRLSDNALNGGGPNGASVFLAHETSGTVIAGCAIDMNGTSNPTPLGGYHPAMVVWCSSCSDMTIDGVTVLDSPGRNIFSAGNLAAEAVPARFTVRHSKIFGGGTTLSGNTNQDDFSAIYTAATGSVIEYNQIYHSNWPRPGNPMNGGIELHGSNSIARGNYIEKGHPAIWIANDSGTTDLTDIDVVDNVFPQAVAGVKFSPAGFADFSRIHIDGNQIGLSVLPGANITPWGISQPRDDSGNFTYRGALKDSDISGNTVMESGQPNTSQSTFTRLSNTDRLSIRNNTVIGLGGAAFTFIGSPWGVNQTVLESNTVIDFGRASGGGIRYAIAVDSTGSSTTPRKTAYDIAGLSIRNNDVRLTAPDSTGSTYGYLLSWSGGSSITDLAIAGNRLTNVSGAYGNGAAVTSMLDDLFVSAAVPSIPRVPVRGDRGSAPLAARER